MHRFLSLLETQHAMHIRLLNYISNDNNNY